MFSVIDQMSSHHSPHPTDTIYVPAKGLWCMLNRHFIVASNIFLLDSLFQHALGFDVKGVFLQSPPLKHVCQQNTNSTNQRMTCMNA